MTRRCTASIRSTWAATATAASRTSAGGEPTYAALHNRGLGNEGLYFEEAKPYEGFLFRQMQRQRRHARRAAREPWRQGALMTP